MYDNVYYDVFTNMFKAVPEITALVTALAYVLGMWMIFYGVKELKNANNQNQDGSKVGITSQVLFIIVGSCLLHLPTSIQTWSYTLLATDTPLGYIEDQGNYLVILYGIVSIVQLIGAIAVIRGLIKLTTPGSRDQEGTSNFQKGITMIIGGILAINIELFVILVLSTLGINY